MNRTRRQEGESRCLFSSIGPGPSVTGARSLGANHSLNVPRCTCRVASFIAFISLLSPFAHPSSLHPGSSPFPSLCLLPLVLTRTPRSSFCIPRTVHRIHTRPVSIDSLHPVRFEFPTFSSLPRSAFLFSSRSILRRSFASRTTDNVTEIPRFPIRSSAASSRMISTRYRFWSRCQATATE